MPSYKLCYFNARGFAEMIRMMFAEKGVEFEDERYTHESWPEHKPNTLFGQVPVLFVDGEQIAHSRAAVRYLAREFKLDGGDSLTAAKIDMWIEVFIESLLKFPIHETDEKKKLEQAQIVYKDVFLPRLVKLEALLKENGGDYVFGKDPTAVDFVVYNILDMYKRKAGGDQFLDPVPKLKDFMTAIEARPNIAKWIEQRPDTEN